MTEKSKRKVNRRRRLLIQLLLAILLVVTLLSSAIYALRPKDPQIVFIAPDANGSNVDPVDQIWILDLATPENPRRLTNFRLDKQLIFMDAPEIGHIIVYQLYDPVSSQYELWSLDLITEQHRLVTSCAGAGTRYGCAKPSIHPNGKWLLYSNVIEDEAHQRMNIFLHDLQTHQTHFITQIFERAAWAQQAPYPQWVGNTPLFEYQPEYIFSEDPKLTVFFSAEDSQVAYTRMLNTGRPYFSNDGSVYAQEDLSQSAPIVFWDSMNPDEIIFQPDPIPEARSIAYILDWHSNQAIVGTQHDINDVHSYEVELYNIDSGNHQTIFSNDRGFATYDASFNFNESKILLGSSTDPSISRAIMIYNTRTNHLVTLPLSGSYPQWVNGGH